MRAGLLKLLLAVAGLLVGALATEIVVRLAFDPPNRVNPSPVPAEIRIAAPFPRAPFALRPEATVVHRFPDDPRGYFDPGATLIYRTNSLGFRGPETSRAKPIHTLRVLGLGDSFTFGTGVRRDDTFLAVAEKILDERSYEAVEVLNLGVMGYDTVSEVALLEFVGVDLDPDLVVICFFLNDARGGKTLQMFNVGPPEDRWSFARHSALADRVGWLLARRRQSAQLIDDYRNSFAADAEGWRADRRALAFAQRLSDRRDFDLVLMIFPVLWRLSDGYPFAEIHRIVASAAGKLSIPVLDLLAAFQGFDGPELWVHPTNQHPNERAHRIAGEALARFLTERGLPTSH